MPEPLAAHLACLASLIRTAPRVLLFSDFDGTLVPIRERPADCFLGAAAREALAALAAQGRVAVAVVSGRGLADLRARVGVAGVTYAGNHGLEIEGPGLSFREPTAVERSGELARLAAELTASLSRVPGAWVENKGLSASVHYRQVRRDLVPGVIETVRRVTAPAVAAGRFVLRAGKMVREVRPAVAWHKGDAVRWLAGQMPPVCEGGVPLYAGDDDTDEDAFAALAGGITICVGGGRQTLASYFAHGHEEVHAFLNWLLGVVGRRAGC
jgi:trehalose-phosphatase